MAAKISEKDRIHIKELVVAGSSAQIQEALDANKLRRKRHKALEVDHDAKEIVFVVTTDTVDRDSERVLPKAFEKNMSYFEENPVVLFSHDHGMPAVGCVTETSISDEQVMQRVKFATDTGYPLADLLWNLYAADERFMRMCSIGFIPLEWSDEASDKLEGQTGLTYKEIEPIELSLVNIGANRYALSALPAKIRNDSVLKSVYEEIVETSEPEGGSSTTRSTTLGATTTEGVLDTAKEEETIQMKEKKTDESEATEDKDQAAGSEKSTEVQSGSEKQNAGGQPGSGTSDAETSSAESAKIAKLEAKLERQRAKSDRLREKNDALRAKLQERPKQVRTKGTNLGDYLDEQLGDDDDRTDTIAEISDAADRSIGTITDIISGDGECPDEMTLEAFSEVLDIDYDTLKELAELDGCEFGDAMDDDDDDDDGEEDGADDDDDMSMKEDEASESETEEEDEDFDEEELENLDAKGIAEFAKGIAELAVKANEGDVGAIRKMYSMSSMFEGSLDDDEDFDEEELENLDAKGIAELAVKANKGDVGAIRKMYYMSGMFEGSFEERQKLIHNNISDYLEYELKLSDSYWVDYTVLATNPNGMNKVLVYSYDKNQVYEVEYEVDGKEINFTSIQSVTLTYQTSSEDMDDEDKASGNGADLVVSDLDPTALAELIQ